MTREMRRQLAKSTYYYGEPSWSRWWSDWSWQRTGWLLFEIVLTVMYVWTCYMGWRMHRGG